jgi:23S rRNA pseudouridine1911/1915/1917 synthase
MSQKKIQHYTLIVEDGSEERLDRYIPQKINFLSRSQVKQLIENNKILIDSQIPAKPGLVIKSGQKIEITIDSPAKLELSPTDLNLEILFEDDHLAVLYKPAGLSVHPSTTENEPTLVHGLLHALRSLSSVGGVERPGIVHRIDKGTSGVLVVSKTDETHRALSELFKKHTITRTYKALVFGELKGSGTIKTFFGRNPKDRKKMTGKLTSGRVAITHYKSVENFKNYSLIECSLETGRTHQIRVHLSEKGFSIVGDPTYGDHLRKAHLEKNSDLKEILLNLNHQLLHAETLGFIHPITNKSLLFKKDIPQDFKQILDLAKHD